MTTPDDSQHERHLIERFDLSDETCATCARLEQDHPMSVAVLRSMWERIVQEGGPPPTHIVIPRRVWGELRELSKRRWCASLRAQLWAAVTRV